MPQYTTIPQRATHTASTGANWNNVSRAYDGDEDSYAERLVGGNSACHINGYSFDLPSNATVDKVVVEFKAYTLNSHGYFAGYLYTDTGSSIAYSIFLDGKAHTSPSYFSLEVPASKIQEKLNSLNVYDKNILTYLKSGVRVRWVGGSKSSWFSTTCRVYDTRVTVYYTVPEKHTVTVTAGTGGSVTGGGTYDYGTSVTIKATPNTGYHFVRWSDGNTSQTRTVTVTSNVTYTAIFEKLKHTVSLSAGTGGSVTGGGTYDYGTQVTLTATPNAGYQFVKWSDGNTSQTRTVTVTSNVTYTAIFEKLKHTVNLSAGEGGSVTGGGTYDYGTSVTIKAVPNTGYHFVRWSDGNTNAERTLTVTANVSLTAYFESDKINKVFSGSTNTSVYIGSTEAGSVSVGNTKIYG